MRPCKHQLALVLLASALVALLPLAKGETVCSCNHNSCVTTNYMCKTRLDAGCFFMKNKTVTSYGCVDQLSEYERLTCKIHPTLPKTRGHVELMCCQQDMCNYEIIKGNFGSDMTESLSGTPPPYLDEFWLKVALIAVPLCGGVILVVLVVLACRILQRDSKYGEAHLRSGYSHCRDSDPGNANRHSKARLLLLDDATPSCGDKPRIYKGPQDPKVITWVIASQHGDKPSAV
ncbi:BMP and activin membrane-bound inhibitor homolog isoform X2 [Neocloeon triangulifer]|uniref:BMP and activin membrane-bound inhibitor homolog isoform X2 n=1 Tax=Neocloeon triangulifer TaxID=2078957 RepID=UPI00286F7AF1|nr:BMP and activin membrane-bound inhibitor homolog isoform X2 [Neocloeon triangulifer]